MFTYQTPTWWVLVGDEKQAYCDYYMTSQGSDDTVVRVTG